MIFKKILVGADHNGYETKAKVIAYLQQLDYDYQDMGAFEFDPEDDFTTFAQAVARQVGADQDLAGVLICGSGQGVAMAANRFQGVRATINHTPEQAMMARKHNDSNVCCLSAKVVEEDQELLERILSQFLDTEFLAEPKYIRRNQKLDEI